MGDDAAVRETRPIVGRVIVIVAGMQQDVVAMRGGRRAVEGPMLSGWAAIVIATSDGVT